MQTSWKKQAKNLSLLLLSAVLAGVLITGYFLRYYGPNGTYLAQNTLLAVPTIEKLKLDQIRLTIFDQSDNVVRSYPITKQAYEQFYNTVAGDRSIPESEGIAFFRSASDTLTIGSQAKNAFQRIEFSADGNHYRVELFEYQQAGSFAYFFHPNILNDMRRTLP